MGFGNADKSSIMKRRSSANTYSTMPSPVAVKRTTKLLDHRYGDSPLLSPVSRRNKMYTPRSFANSKKSPQSRTKMMMVGMPNLDDDRTEESMTGEVTEEEFTSLGGFVDEVNLFIREITESSSSSPGSSSTPWLELDTARLSLSSKRSFLCPLLDAQASACSLDISDSLVTISPFTRRRRSVCGTRNGDDKEGGSWMRPTTTSRTGPGIALPTLRHDVQTRVLPILSDIFPVRQPPKVDEKKLTAVTSAPPLQAFSTALARSTRGISTSLHEITTEASVMEQQSAMVAFTRRPPRSSSSRRFSSTTGSRMTTPSSPPTALRRPSMAS